MDAFTADAPRDDRRSRVECVSEFYLPDVECGACGETWSDTEVWYPSCRLKARALVSRFSKNVEVQWEEFQKLTEAVDTRSQNLKLLPGAGIGRVRATIPAKPTDFLWCGFKMLARRTVISALRERHIRLVETPPVALADGTETDYVPLQLEPVPLYSDATLQELTLEFCSTCGGCYMRNVRAKLHRQREFVHKRVPDQYGLVRIFESPATLATPAFIDVARSKGFSGIQFEKFGVYI